jgi:hypothetical protein
MDAPAGYGYKARNAKAVAQTARRRQSIRPKYDIRALSKSLQIQ